jgi:hypothetical protein
MTLETTIGNIPIVIVNNHNEVLPYWLEQRNATLLHVDAHSDLAEEGEHHESLTPACSSWFGFAEFICPAVYHEIISSIYWLNPHSTKERLRDFRTVGVNESDGRKIIAELMYINGQNRYIWSPPDDEEEGMLISPQDIQVPDNAPFILDIDLDAFCCNQPWTVENTDKLYDECVLDYDQRIEETCGVLQILPSPNIITLARSQGDEESNRNLPPHLVSSCFVSPHLVDDVQECLMEHLRRIYNEAPYNTKQK